MAYVPPEEFDIDLTKCFVRGCVAKPKWSPVVIYKEVVSGREHISRMLASFCDHHIATENHAEMMPGSYLDISKEEYEKIYKCKLTYERSFRLTFGEDEASQPA